MKILGITAEYNPLHRGHIYHINRAKEETGADYTIISMSGNFVQRGEMAILDKWTRAQLVAREAADMVVELPTPFACNRAEIFAQKTVELLAGMGVTHISFGCEDANVEILQAIAHCSIDRAESLAQLRENYMAGEGLSFAKANELALCQSVLEEIDIEKKDLLSIIRGSNNILAIEYLKAIEKLRKTGVEITPVPIRRIGSTIDDINYEKGFAGATEIRRQILEGNLENIKLFLGDGVADLLYGIDVVRSRERAFDIIRREILVNSPEKLGEIYGVGEGLEYKLKKEVIGAKTLEDLVNAITSKRYTSSTVRRILMYILLGLRWEDFNLMCKEDSYARILALGMRGRELVRKMDKEELATVPIITNVNSSPYDSKSLQFDIIAADIYNMIWGRDLYKYSDRVIRPYIHGLEG